MKQLTFPETTNGNNRQHDIATEWLPRELKHNNHDTVTQHSDNNKLFTIEDWMVLMYSIIPNLISNNQNLLYCLPYILIDTYQDYLFSNQCS